MHTKVHTHVHIQHNALIQHTYACALTQHVHAHMHSQHMHTHVHAHQCTHNTCTHTLLTQRWAPCLHAPLQPAFFRSRCRADLAACPCVGAAAVRAALGATGLLCEHPLSWPPAPSPASACSPVQHCVSAPALGFPVAGSLHGSADPRGASFSPQSHQPEPWGLLAAEPAVGHLGGHSAGTGQARVPLFAGRSACKGHIGAPCSAAAPGSARAWLLGARCQAPVRWPVPRGCRGAQRTRHPRLSRGVCHRLCVRVCVRGSHIRLWKMTF